MDPDNSVDLVQTFTYKLIDDAKGRFEIKGNKLQVLAVYCDSKIKETNLFMVYLSNILFKNQAILNNWIMFHKKYTGNKKKYLIPNVVTFTKSCLCFYSNHWQ